jgi:hypothetical protein
VEALLRPRQSMVPLRVERYSGSVYELLETLSGSLLLIAKIALLGALAGTILRTLAPSDRQ